MVEIIKRGDIIIADLEQVRGGEKGGVRPCVVIQTDIGNKFSPMIISAQITDRKFGDGKG